MMLEVLGSPITPDGALRRDDVAGNPLAVTPETDSPVPATVERTPVLETRRTTLVTAPESAIKNPPTPSLTRPG